MSKFFKARHLVGTSVIPLDPNFKCPACGRAEKNVVLFCSTCWPLIPPADQASLRIMTIRKQDTKSKILKCCLIVREKLNKIPASQIEAGAIKGAPVIPFDGS